MYNNSLENVMKKMIVFLALILLPIMARSQNSDKVIWIQDSIQLQGWKNMMIHPSGNIIGIRNTETYELNGLTGKFIRQFKKFTSDNDISTMDISKDGKYIVTSCVETNIIDYNTEMNNAYFNFYPYDSRAAFFPDSKRVLIGSKTKDSTVLMIYNIETKTSQYLPCNFWAFLNVAVSPDGRYFVIAGYYQSNPNDDKSRYTRLILWDALNLVPIKTIVNLKGTGDFGIIRFSNDMKYLAYQDRNCGLWIYNLNDYSIIRNYHSGNKPPQGVMGYCFIGDTYMGLTGCAYDSTDFTEIVNFKTDEVIYHTNEFGSYGSLLEANTLNNSLIVTSTKLGHISLDLSKIVSVSDEPQQPTLNVTYQAGMLLIDNIFFTLSSLSISIFNVQGQVVKTSQINPAQFSQKIQIPLVLNSEVYIVQVIDGCKKYSAKLIIEK